MDERPETTPKNGLFVARNFVVLPNTENFSSEILSQLLLIESVHLINLQENGNVESFQVFDRIFNNTTRTITKFL